MRKICVINRKGGVGKTTTTVNIAAGLARAGKKVLIIDIDPQGNLAKFFKFCEEKKTLYHVLVEKADIKEVIHRVAINLDIVQADERLVQIDSVKETQKERLLSKALAKTKGYDFVMIDCPPSVGLLSQNALVYADEAFVPASCDELGVDALKKMQPAIDKINDSFGHTLRITKVIPTMFDKRSTHSRECLTEIQNLYYERVTSPIRFNTKLKECARAHMSIFSFAKTSPGAQDFADVVRTVLYDEHDGDATLALDIHEGVPIKA